MVVSMIRELRDFADLHFDSVREVTDFIRNCRDSGMDKQTVIGKMVDKLDYCPTEADIIVNEFWDKTA